MASTLSLHLQPPVIPRRHRAPLKSTFLSPLQSRRSPNPNPNPNPSPSVAAALSSPDSFWEREEQRWLREEQRWLREEARWCAERESFLHEIATLRLRLDALERERPGVLSSTAAGTRLALAEDADVKEIVLEEEIRVLASTVEEKEMKKEKRELRMGSEGDDVREMQEALLKLGFYSGEEDMEFSSFSSGTDRAVKTWQGKRKWLTKGQKPFFSSSIGTPEDGIMTAELLERLFLEQSVGSTIFELGTGREGDSVPVVPKDGTNGAVVSSVTEIQETVVEEKADAEVKVYENRVFLLGENRWEEPSRLIGRNNTNGGSKATSAVKCLTCGGVGHLMCTECDGSGEPNIEPQFLEWVGEGAKCPYCNGSGHTTCDVCEGNGTV